MKIKNYIYAMILVALASLISCERQEEIMDLNTEHESKQPEIGSNERARIYSALCIRIVNQEALLTRVKNLDEEETNKSIKELKDIKVQLSKLIERDVDNPALSNSISKCDELLSMLTAHN